MPILQDLFHHGDTNDGINSRKTSPIPDLKVRVEALRSRAAADAEAIKRRQDEQEAIQARAVQAYVIVKEQKIANSETTSDALAAAESKPRRFLPRGTWGLPNVLARSSWATASRRSRSEAHTIAAAVQRGPAVAFGGKTITQAHLTLLMELLRRCIEANKNEIEVVPFSVLTAIGRQGGLTAYKQFRGWLHDMQQASVQIEGSGTGESQSLIPKFSWRTAKGEVMPRYSITIAPMLLTLMESHEVTYIDQAQRLQCGNGLAAWLHTFVASHKQHGLGYCVETLTAAAGVGAARRCDDVKAIRAAISVLIGVGALDSKSRIDPADGLVYLVRP